MTITYHIIPLVFIHRGLRVWGPYQYKDVASQCRDSHYKDEMVWRTCYIYITILIMEITQTWKNGLYIGTEPYILPQCGPYITRLISPKLCEGWDMECFCVLKVWSIVNIGRGRAVYYIQTITGAKLFITTLRPRQNCRHFADEFVPKGPINNIPALVQIMAWRRSVDKPLSESMMV